MNLNCSQCKEGYIQTNDSSKFNKHLCAGFLTIPNCIKYDFDDDLLSSSLNCIGCDKNHFLKESKCEVRVNLNVYCIEYNEEEDKCKSCQPR